MTESATLTKVGNGAHRATIPSRLIRELGWTFGDKLQMDRVGTTLVVSKECGQHAAINRISKK